MTVKTTKPAVNGTAALLATGLGIRGSSIALNPVADIFVGGSDVTTGNGFLVSAGSNFTVDLEQAEELWAVSAAPTTVSLFVQGA